MYNTFHKIEESEIAYNLETDVIALLSGIIKPLTYSKPNHAQWEETLSKHRTRKIHVFVVTLF